MKAAIYLGQENVEVRELSNPVCGDHDVVIKNIYSSICGTDVAVYMHGPGTGHRVDVGGEFGHETISRIVAIGKDVRDVLKIMTSKKWDLDSIITQEFQLEDISQAIQTAADPGRAFNVTIRL